jgi:hypothetical protein
MTYLESAKYELDQLNLWFELNKNYKGSDEWNKNLNRIIDLSETLNDL